MARKCPAITSAGKPCAGIVHPGQTYCMSHDPEYKQSQRVGARKGGEGKASNRRLAKQWAALGEAVGDQDLPAILKSCMFAVKDGSMSPAQANAIAALAKATITIASDLDLAERIEALEAAIKDVPPHQLRRVR